MRPDLARVAFELWQKRQEEIGPKKTFRKPTRIMVLVFEGIVL